jgi:glutathione reductase (NADPH)
MDKDATHMNNNKFDLVVIGAGSAGLACARRAAEQYGKRVVLVEQRDWLGGTCVNVGCVPKKINHNLASLMTDLRHYATGYGLETGDVKLDWPKFCQGRKEHVARINQSYANSLHKANVTVIRGEATLNLLTRSVLVKSTINDNKEDDHRHGDRELQAEHVLIATGSYANVPKETVDGWHLGRVSDDIFLNLNDTLPRKVAIVGSGYVAVESASLFRALGSEVSIFCREDRILTRFDREMACRLTALMRDRQGIQIVDGCSVTKLTCDDRKLLTVHTTCQGARPDFDFCLWAIGRNACVPPTTHGTLEVNSRGFVQVDDFQNTNASGIYAVGDVTGRWMLTPVAIAAGRKLADRLFGGQPQAKLDYQCIPSVVFAHPPLGTVGLTEEEARAQKLPVDVYRTEFANLFEALRPTNCSPEPTFFKAVVHRNDRRVLGLHLLGRSGDEILQGFAVALKLGLTIEQLQAGGDHFVGIHPTAAEELLTMRP